jgi:hypothetical protein
MAGRQSQRGGDRRSGRKYGPNAQAYLLRCVHCLAWFEATRPDALYCSISCKSAAQRFRQSEEGQGRSTLPKRKKRDKRRKPKR